MSQTGNDDFEAFIAAHEHEMKDGEVCSFCGGEGHSLQVLLIQARESAEGSLNKLVGHMIGLAAQDMDVMAVLKTTRLMNAEIRKLNVRLATLESVASSLMKGNLDRILNIEDDDDLV